MSELTFNDRARKRFKYEVVFNRAIDKHQRDKMLTELTERFGLDAMPFVDAGRDRAGKWTISDRSSPTRWLLFFQFVEDAVECKLRFG